MNKSYICIAILLAFLGNAFAQQDPQYTQYMYNMSVVNPAYAGSKETVSLGLLYRKQWVNIEDAPSTGTFFAHTPIGDNIGLGISIISDKIGPVNENNFYGDFSYTITLGDSYEEHRLVFGLKAGFTTHKVGLFSDIYGTLINESDPAFLQNTDDILLNLGAGVFYYTNKYYLGISIPNTIKSPHLTVQGHQFGSEVSHYFITGGYVFDVSPTIKFKPSFMMKSAFNAPTSLDVSANVFFDERIEAGITYRLEDSFGAMVNFSVNSDLRIGYAYDHVVSDLNAVTNASHEFFILYDLPLFRNVSKSPRRNYY